MGVKQPWGEQQGAGKAARSRGWLVLLQPPLVPIRGPKAAPKALRLEFLVPRALLRSKASSVISRDDFAFRKLGWAGFILPCPSGGVLR